MAEMILTHFENFLANKHKLAIYKNEMVSVIILLVKQLSAQNSPWSCIFSVQWHGRDAAHRCDISVGSKTDKTVN